jgi:hypothetical protein
MPPQTYADQAQSESLPAQPRDDQAPAPVAHHPSVSRRSILRGAAGAGALGLAAAAGAGAAAAVTRPQTQPSPVPAAKPASTAPLAPAAMAGPLVVYLSDTAAGEFDVFAGTSQVRVKNPALVGQLLKNIQLAQP